MDETDAAFAPTHNALERPLAAVRRYKWLIGAVTVAAGALGFVATRFVTPEYEVRATVWIANASRTSNTDQSGPIRSPELLNSGAWIELFRSYRIVDDVVRKLKLYVAPEAPADRPLFAEFALADRFAPGAYELTLDRTAKRWALATAVGATVESGTAADSVGRKVGFAWRLPDTAFAATGQRVVRFTVVPPRERSAALLNQVGNRLAAGSNFLWLTYSDLDPKRAERILNTWLDAYVQVAADLKKRNVVEFAKVLESQLRFAEKTTQDAEAAYQNFRVNTIILPTEGGPVAARGVEADRDPALASFFDQKIEYDNLRHDREALEQNIKNAAAARTPYEGLLFIPSVAQSPGAQALRNAFERHYALQADLRIRLQTFTDQHPAVIEVNTALDVLRNQTIPQLANQLLAQLRERENDYQRRIQAASKELREIPPRTIEERRLSRAVAVSEALYTNLKGRFAEAQLAAASATPDISVLDTAIAPLSPTKNTASMVILLAVIGGLGAAIALALLLDHLDGRIRYAYQATSELGLVVAGAVPRIPKGGLDVNSAEQVVQFVESFRTLRMHVLNSGPSDRVVLAVTSAAPSDGKSLISMNLALSFAEAGLKTVLIDGDTRRGTLHRMTDMKPVGGLTEYLDGRADETQIVRQTRFDNLSLITCGARHPRSPELLATPRLKRLVEQLSRSFDVVIFDTPPLAAGIDGYAISAAAGSVLMVLRMGETERRLASAKLATLDRLPVDIIGAVLNAAPQSGEFNYYSYASGYSVIPGEHELIGTTSR
jgi:succinoglycan biosynthesis transport protein ExoP